MTREEVLTNHVKGMIQLPARWHGHKVTVLVAETDLTPPGVPEGHEAGVPVAIVLTAKDLAYLEPEVGYLTDPEGNPVEKKENPTGLYL